ncbi:MAG: very short patch repair endonuclease [Pyrinomonadaceae bacterium]
MSDVHTPEQRSFNMSRIRNWNTRPEMKVRSLAHRMGFRYRLHRKDLPGKPDLVFPARRKVIFVHGCFFHMHNCRYGMVTPKTNAEFWQKKRLSNVARDRNNIMTLELTGWEVLVVWECQTKAPDLLSRILVNFLRQGATSAAASS